MCTEWLRVVCLVVTRRSRVQAGQGAFVLSGIDVVITSAVADGPQRADSTDPARDRMLAPTQGRIWGPLTRTMWGEYLAESCDHLLVGAITSLSDIDQPTAVRPKVDHRQQSCSGGKSR